MTEPTLDPEDVALEEAKELAAVLPTDPIPGTNDLPDDVPDGPVLSGPDEAPDEPTLPKED